MWTFLIFLLNPGIKVDLSTLKDKMEGCQLLKIICISFIWWPNLLPTLLNFGKIALEFLEQKEPLKSSNF